MQTDRTDENAQGHQPHSGDSRYLVAVPAVIGGDVLLDAEPFACAVRVTLLPKKEMSSGLEKKNRVGRKISRA